MLGIYTKKRTVLILFVLAGAFLLSSTLSFQIEYYDSAVLEGLWLPSVLFVFSICLVFIFGEFEPKSLAILSSIYLTVINLIPSLKYKLLYNSADTMAHFMLAGAIYESGFIPTREEAYVGYVDFPAFHILNAIISLTSGVQLSLIAKLITFVLWGLMPIIILMISKQLGFNRNAQKFAIFASLLLYCNNKYFIASSMAFFLVFTAISLMLFRDEEGSSGYNILILTLIVAVLFTHHYTSFMLTLYLLTAFMFSSFFQSARKKFQSILPLAMFSLVLLFAWWMYHANIVFSIFARHVRDYLLGAEAESLSVSPFATEVAYPLRELLLLILTSRPGTIVTVAISGLGLILLLRNFRKYIRIEKTNQFLLLISYVAMSLIFTIAYYLVPTREISIERTIILGLIVAPIFSGIALQKITASAIEKKHGKLVLVLLFTLLFSTALTEYFPSEDRPYGFPINLANSIYKKQQAEFIQTHLLPEKTVIIAIEETNMQLMGFGGPTAYARTLLIGKEQRDEIFLNFLGVQEGDPAKKVLKENRAVFLLNYEGKAGHKYQKLRIKERESGIRLDQKKLVDEAISKENVDLVYDAGESFVAVY